MGVKRLPEFKITKTKVKRQTRSTRPRLPRQPKTCRLLALPGELRNHIYRHVLLESNRIDVTPRSPSQPALLSVRDLVRKEAGPIYYSENSFKIEVQDYDGASFAPFNAIHLNFTRANLDVENIGIRFSGLPDWDNLVAWIKTEHFDGNIVPNMEMQAGDDPDEYVVAGAFGLYDALGDASWGVKEAALKAFYTGLKGTDLPWVKEEDRV